MIHSFACVMMSGENGGNTFFKNPWEPCLSSLGTQGNNVPPPQKKKNFYLNVGCALSFAVRRYHRCSSYLKLLEQKLYFSDSKLKVAF